MIAVRLSHWDFTGKIMDLHIFYVKEETSRPLKQNFSSFLSLGVVSWLFYIIEWAIVKPLSKPLACTSSSRHFSIMPINSVAHFLFNFTVPTISTLYLIVCWHSISMRLFRLTLKNMHLNVKIYLFFALCPS